MEEKPLVDFLTILLGFAAGFALKELLTFQNLQILKSLMTKNSLALTLPFVLILITLLCLVEHWRMYSVLLSHPPLAMHLDLATVAFAVLAIDGFRSAIPSISDRVDTFSETLSRACIYFTLFLTLAALRFVWHMWHIDAFQFSELLPFSGHVLGALMGLLGWYLLKKKRLFLTFALGITGLITVLVYLFLVEILVVSKILTS